jgi:hypothetical protein
MVGFKSCKKFERFCVMTNDMQNIGSVEMLDERGCNHHFKIFYCSGIQGITGRFGTPERKDFHGRQANKSQSSDQPPVKEPPNEPKKPPVKEPEEPPEPPPPPSKPPVQEPPDEPEGPPIKETPPKDPDRKPPQRPPVKAMPDTDNLILI